MVQFEDFYGKFSAKNNQFLPTMRLKKRISSGIIKKVYTQK